MCALGAAAALATPTAPLTAQAPGQVADSLPPGRVLVRDPVYEVLDGVLVTLGSPDDERRRLGQLLGTDSTPGTLLRSPSTLSAALAARSRLVRVHLLYPELRTTRNGALPTADPSDGALWAGRGISVLARAGLAARIGRVSLVVVPELTRSQNLGFQSTPAGPSGQFPSTGSYAAEWFSRPPYSVDLPVRFGDVRYATIGFGQSSLAVDVGPTAIGFSTENQWWGPGVQNALLMGSAAEGVPQGFVRTRRPLRTAIGDVEARWLVGGLTASRWFRNNAPLEPRSLSGAVATLRLRAAPGLTVGAARLVLDAVPTSGRIAGRAFDVFTRNDNLGAGDTLPTRRDTDQLTSVFARWVFPESGTEAYAEIARQELPRSLRDFFLAPLNTGAYTLGLAQAWRVRGNGAVVGRLETTSLEQTRTFTDRPPPPDFYTGRAAYEGFTNRGQPLGAAIGPGSSSQWAAVDWLGERAHLGLFARRVRYQNDALFRVFLANLSRHDVAVGGGVRGGWRLAGWDARAELGLSKRMNYLFQNGAAYTFGVGTVDVQNLTLSLDVSPRAPRVRR